MSEFRPYPKSGMPAKKDKKPLKKSRIKYKKKDTGQISIFEDIASEREWVCFVTGQTLYQLTATSFCHFYF